MQKDLGSKQTPILLGLDQQPGEIRDASPGIAVPSAKRTPACKLPGIRAQAAGLVMPGAGLPRLLAAGDR